MTLDEDKQELLDIFFDEAQNLVNSLEENLLYLEADPQNLNTIDEIFRIAHTLKGSAATVEFLEISEFTHILEDVFDEIRDSKIKITEKLCDLLLNSLDLIKAMVEERGKGEVFQGETQALKEKLKALLKKDNEELKSSQNLVPIDSEENLKGIEQALSEYENVFKIQVDFKEDNLMKSLSAFEVMTSLKDCGELLKTSPKINLEEDKFFKRVTYYLDSSLEREAIFSKINLKDVVENIFIEKINNFESLDLSSASESDSRDYNVKNLQRNLNLSSSNFIRLEAEKVDHILNLVSEAVIGKSVYNQLANDLMNNFYKFNYVYDLEYDLEKKFIQDLTESLKSEGIFLNSDLEKQIKLFFNKNIGEIFKNLDLIRNSYLENIQRLKTSSLRFSRIISDLHNEVLNTRMLPISTIFNKFYRVVRDLSKKLDKDVELVIEGADTQLDKKVIDELFEPLLHCIRNAIDHGIEKREERERREKSLKAKLLVRAKNEGNIVLIQIRDDGRGLDVEGLKNKAIENNLIKNLENLAEEEIFNLIFLPGFSTAKEITEISGRGVGMDVVKNNIEKLSGTIQVESRAGEGTTFNIRIPLTLVIVNALLVKVANEIYALPLSLVLETRRINEGEIKVLENGFEVYNIREDIISILNLRKLFKLKVESNSLDKFLIVLNLNNKKMGIMVDFIIGEEDIVVKPLQSSFVESKGIIGATILGSGNIALILDVLKLVDLSYDQIRL